MKKKLLSVFMIAALGASLAACGNSSSTGGAEDSTGSASGETYKIGVCNYVDDASLNQIYANLESQLNAIGEENNVTFDIEYQNANADAAVMEQIISGYINSDKVDLLVGIATPVAMQMQAATSDSDLPVIFSAVSDPVGAGLVDSLEEPGANITGTSDYLNTTAVLDLMFAQNPDIQTVGLLYDQGQDSSTAPIADAKAYLDEKGIKYVEKTGTTNDEVALAADNLVSQKVDAVFTPTDNTIMTAELSIADTFAEAGIPHYCGADSFALNGSFVGYGVDYANLGKETANMVADVLLEGADPATTEVMTFDNGTCTINTDICDTLGLDLDTVKATFEPLCTEVKEIQTAEEFDQ